VEAHERERILEDRLEIADETFGEYVAARDEEVAHLQKYIIMLEKAYRNSILIDCAEGGCCREVSEEIAEDMIDKLWERSE
jgi:hypothetical protein